MQSENGKPETPNLQDDIEMIRRLIDLASFTNSETLLAAKFRADEAIDRIEAAWKTIHPERGDLDKMTKKPASVRRELEEARRIVSRVIVPPAEEVTDGST